MTSHTFGITQDTNAGTSAGMLSKMTGGRETWGNIGSESDS